MVWYAKNIIIFSPLLGVYHPDVIFDVQGPWWLKRTISELQNKDFLLIHLTSINYDREEKNILKEHGFEI